MAEARGSLHDFMARHGLTRETLGAHPWMKPFAARVMSPELWRFTRRSVPRGVALGLLVGIFLLIPGVQIIGVALLALPVRANIPIGAAMTFLSMPATTPFILLASVWVGNRMFGMKADVGHFMQLLDSGASLQVWLDWFLSSAAPALLVGLAVISVVLATVGYLIASFGWRWWISRKWRRRPAAQKMTAHG
jgi:uncharacterized protein (DUF2062 family)